MTFDMWEKLTQGIWDAELGLDYVSCKDSDEPEEIAGVAEVLLYDVTRIRRRIVTLRERARQRR